jgi:hypothetical protein
VDAFRLRTLVLNVFQAQEQAYFAQQYGLLGPAEWRRFERQICVAYAQSQASADISATVSRLMTEEFVAFMAETCRE